MTVKTLLFAVVGLCLGASICHARIGETVPEIEARYGKHLKDAKPLLPATSAFKYQQKAIGYFVGFTKDIAVYEMVQAVEDDGDFGEDNLTPAQIDAALKAQTAEWTEIKDIKDGAQHWQSADGKLVASYSKKKKALLIEAADFAEQRKAKAKH